jgi:phosphatidate cytidylyltransferase
MLRTRLLMGSVLAALVVGMLIVDENLSAHPFQLAFQLLLSLGAWRELKALLGPSRPTHGLLALGGVSVLNVIPWIIAGGPFFKFFPAASIEIVWRHNDLTWATLLFAVVFLQLLVFLVEMASFDQPGSSFERMARTWMVIAYLGLLPSFFAQLRWLYPANSPLGTTALALAIFVPKGCDIGAYFTGRMLGRHPMAPILSPKKTWEGAIGGLLLAAGFSVGIDRLFPASALGDNFAVQIGFGLSIGLVGMLGDLAESLIKRDCQQKDASQTVPGFGGVLDVIDSVIFAAPVAYVWLLAIRPAL